MCSRCNAKLRYMRFPYSQLYPIFRVASCNQFASLYCLKQFLSMKLATVNPQMDFNLEGLLAKDVKRSYEFSLSFILIIRFF